MNERASTQPDGNRQHVDVAVIGGGSAAQTLVSELGTSDLSVVVFEPALVGGECPFVACMPSKAMLHDAAIGRSWRQAVQRRRDVVDDLDDHRHAADIVASGALLVRERAVITAPGELRAGPHLFSYDHLVLATGSDAMVPPIDGLDTLGERCWRSPDAMTATDRPTRLTIVGGGVIGCELATVFSRFGTEVHLLDSEAAAFADLPAEIGAIVDDALRSNGVRVRRGTQILSAEPRGSGVRVRLEGGACVDTDRILIATGTRPRIAGIGLDQLGLDESTPLTVDETGRVEAPGSIWAIGDVAGKGEYTHLANHQARVVAGALTGRGSRRFDDVVTPACVFTDPPIVTIGPNPSELGDGVVWVSARLSEIARWTTDELVDGFLAIAVDPATHAVVAAHGIGADFDVLAAALVGAIDTGTPVERLARSMFPFPTIGELLGVLYSRASASLSND
jgi:dihydrolipoamide dehydrogenase